MAFYKTDPGMIAKLSNVLDKLENQGLPNLKNSIAISWIKYPKTNPEIGSGFGAGWDEQKLFYPASVVKLIYGIAAELWIQKDLISETPEFVRALQEMLKESSNDGTSLIIDLITGTTSGPSLTGDRWEAWKKQRNLINQWLRSLNWQELEKVNCCQKTWGDGPFGREKDFYGPGNVNRNSLSTDAIARILEAIMTNNLVAPQRCKTIQALISRSLDEKARKANPENQIDGFIGEGLPKGSRIWSKAGWMSQARHDVAWFTCPQSKPMILVIFTQGREYAKNNSLLPQIANDLCS